MSPEGSSRFLDAGLEASSGGVRTNLFPGLQCEYLCNVIKVSSGVKTVHAWLMVVIALQFISSHPASAYRAAEGSNFSYAKPGGKMGNIQCGQIVEENRRTGNFLRTGKMCTAESIRVHHSFPTKQKKISHYSHPSFILVYEVIWAH